MVLPHFAHRVPLGLKKGGRRIIGEGGGVRRGAPPVHGVGGRGGGFWRYFSLALSKHGGPVPVVYTAGSVEEELLHMKYEESGVAREGEGVGNKRGSGANRKKERERGGGEGDSDVFFGSAKETSQQQQKSITNIQKYFVSMTMLQCANMTTQL